MDVETSTPHRVLLSWIKNQGWRGENLEVCSPQCAWSLGIHPGTEGMDVETSTLHALFLCNAPGSEGVNMKKFMPQRVLQSWVIPCTHHSGHYNYSFDTCISAPKQSLARSRCPGCSGAPDSCSDLLLKKDITVMVITALKLVLMDSLLAQWHHLVAT